MGFLDRFVSGMIQDATGFNARKLVRRVGGKRILMMGGAALGGALLADKMQSSGPGADRSAARPSSTLTPPTASTHEPPTSLPPLPTAASAAAPAAAPPELPPLPVPAGSEPVERVEASEEPPASVVFAIVRTMVAAALADGELSADEKELIQSQLADSSLTPEQVQQVHRDLVLPASVSELADLVRDDDPEVLYRFGALVAGTHGHFSDHEREWLGSLGQALAIPTTRQREIEGELFPQ